VEIIGTAHLVAFEELGELMLEHFCCQRAVWLESGNAGRQWVKGSGAHKVVTVFMGLSGTCLNDD
jgi:hypothetical protein